jgi:glycosyltransferase involved in cell wall biosynthesis
MKIGIDATLLQKGRFTGIENYTLNLIKFLGKIDKFNRYLLFFRKEVPREQKKISSNFEYKISPTANRVITDQIWMPLAIKKARIDLLHCPAFPSPVLTNCPTILTIPDAVLWKYPKTISKGGRFYYRPLFPQAISKAKKIITLSNSTKDDLISIFPTAKERIKVTYLAADPNVFSSNSPGRNNDGHPLGTRQYILTVGSIEPRKNLPTLLEAFRIVKHRMDTDIKLVIVGRRAWLKALQIPDCIKKSVIITGYIDSAKNLARIYRDALVFVFPSIYEGFGLPLLESMCSGTPVLCSNASSLMEVAGNAAEYADPHDPNDFADKIINMVKGPELREKLIQRGFQRARLFSWEKTAKETLSVYEEIKSTL